MNIKKFVYKSVNSTNDIAIKLIKKSKIKAGLIVSEKQKKGRGQRGKKWISHKGNLFATIFFSLDKNIIIICQWLNKLINGTYKNLINTVRAATLGTTAKNKVTGVGEPS